MGARPARKKISPSLKDRYLLLESTAARLGVEVRVEKMRPAAEELPRPVGGLVRLGERRVVYLDKDQPLEVRAQVLAQALAGLIDASIYVPPAIREWLED